jgi:hypothetical protein
MSESNDTGPNKPTAQQEVGRANPLARRRFKENIGGKGRPKGSKNRKTTVKEVANEMHAVTENGKPRKRSTLELVLFKLRNMALAGKPAGAFEEFDRLTKAYIPQAPSGNYGVLVAPAYITPEEWVAQAEEQNKTAKIPEGCEDELDWTSED